MRRVMVAAIISAGCGLPPFLPDPDDEPPAPIQAFVRVVDEAGQPVPGAPLRRGNQHLTADDAGILRFTVAAYNAGILDPIWRHAAMVSLDVPQDAGLIEATSMINVYGGSLVELPPLPWQASDLRVEQSGGQLTVGTSWDGGVTSLRVCLGAPDDAGFGSPCRYASATSATYDARFLEDFGGNILAITNVGDSIEYGLDLRRRAILAPGLQVPVSRAARCSADGVALAGCPLTDGVLGTVTLPALTSELSLELPAPGTLTTAFLRELSVERVPLDGGVDGGWAIETTADGVQWTAVATFDGPRDFVLEPVPLEDAGPASRVRLRSDPDAGYVFVKSNELSFY